MNKLLKAIQEVSNITTTENGMLAYDSTLDACLDLFYKGPGLRNNIEELSTLVLRSALRDEELTLKILFYLRDIRGNGVGQGERIIFREGLKTFIKFIGTYRTIQSNFVEYIPTYGRWDDLFCLFDLGDNELDKFVLNIIKQQLELDLRLLEKEENVSLLAKWLPSHKTGSKNSKGRLLARKIRKGLGLSEKEYRKALSALRAKLRIVERNLTTKDYTFDYSNLPAKARMLHSKANGAFLRNDSDRYTKFVQAREKGEIKANTATLYPYEIVKRVRDLCNYDHDLPELKSLEADWRDLPDYFEGVDPNISWLPIIDTSGSMHWGCSDNFIIPLNVALGIGLYVSERNKGIFKNAYITFSDTPALKYFNDKVSLSNKLALTEINCSNTDLEKAFDLILNAAIKHNCSQEDMPNVILIISDMQFDEASDVDTDALQMIRNKYENAGYTMHKIVFWDVSYRSTTVPVTMSEEGVLLVSGCKPGLFRQIIQNDNPIDIMLDAINSERYSSLILFPADN